MNEKFEHGFARDPVHDANRDLRTEIWLGEGTPKQNAEPVTRLRNMFQENGIHDTVLLMHPPQSGNKWWNFTMNIPTDKNYDLQITYGYAANAKGRQEPIEYSVLFDNKRIMKDTKYFTGQLSNLDVNLDTYSSDTIKVSLSTDSLDYGYNKAWTFFKLKFIK